MGPRRDVPVIASSDRWPMRALLPRRLSRGPPSRLTQQFGREFGLRSSAIAMPGSHPRAKPGRKTASRALTLSLCSAGFSSVMDNSWSQIAAECVETTKVPQDIIFDQDGSVHRMLADGAFPSGRGLEHPRARARRAGIIAEGSALQRRAELFIVSRRSYLHPQDWHPWTTTSFDWA
jgi:hypothetical protein